MTGVPAVETHHGLEVSFCGLGYDTRDGYRVIGGHAQVWRSKAEAAKAARIAGPAFSAQPAHTALSRRLWVLHDDHGGGFLTPTGWEQARALYAAQHRTRTFAINHEGLQPYNVNSRGMTGLRLQFQTIWVCSCGNGGFGEDRDRASAQQRAKQHRDDPVCFPGTPWPNRATVAAVRNS